MHCIGGHALVSIFFVAVPITLFWFKTFSLLVYSVPFQQFEIIAQLSTSTIVLAS